MSWLRKWLGVESDESAHHQPLPVDDHDDFDSAPHPRYAPQPQDNVPGWIRWMFNGVMPRIRIPCYLSYALPYGVPHVLSTPVFWCYRYYVQSGCSAKLIDVACWLDSSHWSLYWYLSELRNPSHSITLFHSFALDNANPSNSIPVTPVRYPEPLSIYTQDPKFLPSMVLNPSHFMSQTHLTSYRKPLPWYCEPL